LTPKPSVPKQPVRATVPPASPPVVASTTTTSKKKPPFVFAPVRGTRFQPKTFNAQDFLPRQPPVITTTTAVNQKANMPAEEASPAKMVKVDTSSSDDVVFNS
jgi:hypothetical protein